MKTKKNTKIPVDKTRHLWRKAKTLEKQRVDEQVTKKEINEYRR